MKRDFPFSRPQDSIGSLIIVEDSHVHRQHLKWLVQQLGFNNVHEAANGLQALEALDELGHLPTGAILGLEMPHMDGIEFIEELRRRNWRLPILIASGQDDALLKSVEAMILNLGLPLLGSIGKPLRFAELEALLSRLKNPEFQTSMPFVPASPKTDAEISANDLREAIKSGHIELHYQPKVDMTSGVAVGVEALARWKHSKFGNISPERFIPLAEREGLIHALTMSVFNQAMSQAGTWKRQGIELTVALNISPLLLGSADLVREILELTHRHSVSPAQIILEITESSSANQFGGALGVLARLRLNGFGLSIDDYGIGFSSMQQLIKMPFTELKFDRSFVHGAHHRKNLQIVLQTSLDMSQRLGLTSVAEGLETFADWQLLRNYGCAMGQGWLIARPMPAVDVPGWLVAHRSMLPELSGGALDVGPTPTFSH